MKKLVLMSLLVFLVFIISCSNVTLKGKSNSLTGNVVKASTSQEVQISKNICSEEDGGLNFDKRSVVTGAKEGIAFMKMDECLGNVLQEYYCESRELKLQNNICENGCYAGRCE